MRCGPAAWAQAANALSDEELSALIKSLTRLEGHPGFSAGSVSPVIWLFRRLADAGDHLQLVNWVLSNTENEYLPFGSPNHGAKSFDEYKEACCHVIASRAARGRAERNRQAEAKKSKAAEASRRLFGAIHRKDDKAITALLRRGADPGVLDPEGQSALQLAQSAGLGHLFNVKVTQEDAHGGSKKQGERICRTT